jgi:hypothetical protein
MSGCSFPAPFFVPFVPFVIFVVVAGLIKALLLRFSSDF